MSIEFVAGSTEYINCGSGASIDDVATKTVVFWVALDDISANHSLVNKGKPGTNSGWALLGPDEAGTSDYIFRFQQGFLDQYGGWSTDNKFVYGQRYHVAVAYDKGSVNNNPIFYVNGSVEANTEADTPSGAVGSDAAKSLIIGVHNDLANTPFDGTMEDFRVLNRIATPEEIAALAAGYRGPLGGEVIWLNMNEATAAAGAWEGTSLGNGTNLLPDLSVNSNNGDPTNTPTGRASKFSRYGVAV